MTELENINQEKDELLAVVSEAEAVISDQEQIRLRCIAKGKELEADTETEAVKLSEMIADNKRELEVASNAIEITKARIGAIVPKVQKVFDELKRVQGENNQQIEDDNVARLNEFIACTEFRNALEYIKCAWDLSGQPREFDRWIVERCGFHGALGIVPERPEPVQQVEYDNNEIRAIAINHQYRQYIKDAG